MKRIAVTSGDVDGIGLEVTAKALAKMGPQKSTLFYLFRSPNCDPALLRKIGRQFRRREFRSWPEALKYQPKNTKELIEIVSSVSPAAWVETAAQAQRSGSLDALVTAPLSKQTILKSGMKDIGHTDILKRVCQRDQAFMGFVGEKFSVVLATAHVPLSQVAQTLTSQVLVSAAKAALELRAQLNLRRQSLPVAFLGLNPHAGDGGLIGKEEELIFSQAFKELKDQGIEAVGPLVPDAAFSSANFRKYSVFIASYHDQGLIPFKAIHGYDSGVHLTLGLPLKRTSVDHGTAKDIFGQNKANPGSMIAALEWAVRWVKG